MRPNEQQHRRRRVQDFHGGALTFVLIILFSLHGVATDQPPERQSPLPDSPQHKLPFESGKWEGGYYPNKREDAAGAAGEIGVTFKWKYKKDRKSGTVSVKTLHGRFNLPDGTYPFQIESDTDHVIHLDQRTIEFSDSPIRHQQCVIVKDSEKDGYYCLYSTIGTRHHGHPTQPPDAK